MGDRTVDFRWKAADVLISGLNWQNLVNTEFKIGAQAGGLLRVIRIDVKFRSKPLVKESCKGQTETTHHRRNTNVGSHRDQKRHQRQRQAWKLLARIRPEPFLNNRFGMPRASGK